MRTGCVCRNRTQKTISVIIGNPPYNANQQNENDNNKNREYPEIDKRIKDTYVDASTAQKTKQYDMYKRFIRWASDRLDDDGVIAFVSNSAFLDSRQDDGFRKVVAQEFNELWAIDLKGNARTSGERRRREGGNIFEDKIRVGVAIYFLVRRQGAEGFKVFYNAVDDYAKAPAKDEYIQGRSLATFDFSDITPDAKGIWLNQSDTDFDSLLPLADRQAKLAKLSNEDRAVFRLYTLGVSTNRDDWVYDFDSLKLKAKASFFAKTYNDFLDAADHSFDPIIKWSRDLRNEFLRGKRIVQSESDCIHSLYRPFTIKHHFVNFIMNDVLTRNHYEIFSADLKQPNRLICFLGSGARRPFATLATDKLPSLAMFIDGTQCLPLYRYAESGERVSNITDWGLTQFREHYGDESITVEEVFAYIYAVLHDPEYRDKYAIDLLREFPRLPFYPEFRTWAEIGQSLLDLHIGFESAELHPLHRRDAKAKAGKPRLRADKERGQIILDGQTTLEGVPKVAWEYRLGNRSALEWVLDQYKERKPKDPTIAEKFNTYRFADYKEQVIDLLRRVCTVSVRTMELIDTMPARSVLIPTER